METMEEAMERLCPEAPVAEREMECPQFLKEATALCGSKTLAREEALWEFHRRGAPKRIGLEVIGRSITREELEGCLVIHDGEWMVDCAKLKSLTGENPPWVKALVTRDESARPEHCKLHYWVCKLDGATLPAKLTPEHALAWGAPMTRDEFLARLDAKAREEIGSLLLGKPLTEEELAAGLVAFKGVWQVEIWPILAYRKGVEAAWLGSKFLSRRRALKLLHKFYEGKISLEDLDAGMSIRNGLWLLDVELITRRSQERRAVLKDFCRAPVRELIGRDLISRPLTGKEVGKCLTIRRGIWFLDTSRIFQLAH